MPLTSSQGALCLKSKNRASYLLNEALHFTINKETS
jgi:hypothetical protein